MESLWIERHSSHGVHVHVFIASEFSSIIVRSPTLARDIT
jgi:hypothetical protein